MKHSNLFFYFMLLCSMSVNAQYNLVPNPGFEQGNEFGQVPRCKYYSGGGTNESWIVRRKRAKDFEKDIAYWAQALLNPVVDDESSDWIGANCFNSHICMFNASSQRCAYSGQWEGIRVTLKKNGVPYLLKGGQTYTFRIKFYAHGNSYQGIRLMFATWAEHWNSNKNANKKFNDAVTIGDENLLNNYGCGWVSYSKTFTVPQNYDNKLGNLIILHNYLGGAGSTNVYMDDVELYEGDCSQDLRVENKTYASVQTAPYEHKTIYAGYDAGDPNDAGKVVVESTADLKYKASQSVSLLPGFEVKSGAKFRAYIAPCDRLCFYPTADAGNNTTLCGPNQTYQLGFPNLGPDNSTYLWTAEPANAISYLSSTTIHNPVFNGPATGLGLIKYTQRATNSCGEVVYSDVYINYDAQPSASPYVNVSNTSMKPLAFDLAYNTHTELIKIDVFDQSNTTLLGTYSLEKGIDFTTNPFRWTLPEPEKFPFCNNYYIRVSSKNYCYSNWSSTTGFAWNVPPYPDKSMVIGTVPNVITPDGNGINDELCVTASGVLEYSIRVRNRWGALVYEESNIFVNGESPVCMWNGYCTASGCPNNNIVPDGTYYYDVDFKGCGGSTAIIREQTVQVFGASNKTQTNVDEKHSGSTTQERLLFPNPTAGRFTIQTTTSMKAVEVLDALGRIIYSEKVSGTITAIQLNNVRSGIYFVRTLLEDNSSFIDKLSISEENH